MDSMNSTSLHRHSLGATGRTNAAAIFKETNHHIDHHEPPLLPTPANENHQGKTELRTNAGHQSTHHQQKGREPRAQKSDPNLAFRLLPNHSNQSKNQPLRSLTASGSRQQAAGAHEVP
jgi:hypothetical protein